MFTCGQKGTRQRGRPMEKTWVQKQSVFPQTKSVISPQSIVKHANRRADSALNIPLKRTSGKMQHSSTA